MGKGFPPVVSFTRQVSILQSLEIVAGLLLSAFIGGFQDDLTEQIFKTLLSLQRIIFLTASFKIAERGWVVPNQPQCARISQRVFHILRLVGDSAALHFLVTP